MWTPEEDNYSSGGPGLLRVNYPQSQEWQHPSFFQTILGGLRGQGGGGQGGGYGGYGGSNQSMIAGPLRRKLFGGVGKFFL